MQRKWKIRTLRIPPDRFAALALCLLAMAGSCLAGFVAPAFAESLGRLFPGLPQSGRRMVFAGLWYLLFFLLPAVAYLSGRPRLSASTRLNPEPIGMLTLTGIAAILTLATVTRLTAVWLTLLQKIGLDTAAVQSAAPGNRQDLTFLVIESCLFAPVCEELLCRGIALPAWENHGTRRAMVISALLFTMLHGSLAAAPAAFVAGLVSAWLVIWTDSLYEGMIFHMLYNVFALFSAVRAGEPAETRVFAPIAGWSGIWGMLAGAALFGLLLFALLWAIRGWRAMRMTAMEIARESAGNRVVVHMDDPDVRRRIREQGWNPRRRIRPGYGERLLWMAVGLTYALMLVISVWTMLA